MRIRPVSWTRRFENEVKSLGVIGNLSDFTFRRDETNAIVALSEYPFPLEVIEISFVVVLVNKGSDGYWLTLYMNG